MSSAMCAPRKLPDGRPAAGQDRVELVGQKLAQDIEATVIDPWQALAAHRPLGDVQRARKVVYFASQQGRGAV